MGLGIKQATVFIALCVTTFVAAQNPGVQLSGTFENYYFAKQQKRGAQHRITWMQLTAEVNPHLRFVATEQQRISANSLDETYGEFEHGGTTLRAGVMRRTIGFGDWAELYYTGFIAFPMIRGEYLGDNINLLQLDTGVQVSGGSPNLQYQASLVDSARSSRQFFPQKLDHAIARIQTAKGPFIIGASGFKQVVGSDESKVRIYGLDIRWTAPQIQIRAEADKVDTDESTSEGYYIDTFYRPGKSTKSRLMARAEGFRAPYVSATAVRYTFGLRQVLTENFTLSVNYGIGNRVAPANSNVGWSAQLMTSVHF